MVVIQIHVNKTVKYFITFTGNNGFIGANKIEEAKKFSSKIDALPILKRLREMNYTATIKTI